MRRINVKTVEGSHPLSPPGCSVSCFAEALKSDTKGCVCYDHIGSQCGFRRKDGLCLACIAVVSQWANSRFYTETKGD